MNSSVESHSSMVSTLSCFPFSPLVEVDPVLYTNPGGHYHLSDPPLGRRELGRTTKE